MPKFKKVKTRKEHICRKCGKPILAKTSAYSKSVKKYRGGWAYLIYHEKCYLGGKVKTKPAILVGEPEEIKESPAWFDGGTE